MNDSTGHTNTFQRNIILLLFINLIIKPVYVLFIEAEVQNVVGPNAYGVYFSLINFCMLFNIVLDLGIQNYNSKFISQNRALVQEHFSVVMGTKVVLIVGFLGLALLGGVLIQFPPAYFWTLLGVGLILILNSLSLYLRSHFSALGFYRKDVWLSAIDKSLLVICLGYFLYILDTMSIQLFITTQIGVLVFTCFVFLILLSRHFKLSIQFSIKKSTALIGQTAPYAMVLLLMTIFTRLDGVMLERLLDDEAYSAGVYAAGFRLLDAANMIGILFASLLIPMFSRSISDHPALKALFTSSAQILLLLSSLISLACWFYADEIMNAIYTNTTDEYVLVFKLLMIAFWAMVNANIFGCMFLASGHLKQINYLFVLAIIINFALNYIMIPNQGAEGAANATIVTQFLSFIGICLLAWKQFQLSYLSKTTLKTLLWIALIGLLLVLFHKYIDIFWLLELTIVIIFAGVISFLAGVLRFPNSQYLERK